MGSLQNRIEKKKSERLIVFTKGEEGTRPGSSIMEKIWDPMLIHSLVYVKHDLKVLLLIAGYL
jgi:hypothetical protein